MALTTYTGKKWSSCALFSIQEEAVRESQQQAWQALHRCEAGWSSLRWVTCEQDRLENFFLLQNIPNQ